jgi:hypothetical protein
MGPKTEFQQLDTNRSRSAFSHGHAEDDEYDQVLVCVIVERTLELGCHKRPKPSSPRSRRRWDSGGSSASPSGELSSTAAEALSVIGNLDKRL